MPRSFKLHFLILAFALLPSLSHAAETKVTKPAIPPSATAASSAAAPKKTDGGFVAGIISRFNEIKNLFCPEPQPSPIAIAPAKVPVAKEPPRILLKSEGELRRYLECYSPTDAIFDDIDKTYLPLIESAARTYGVPKALLACLIFAESKFRTGAKSHTGAFGLGQHTKGTAKHITTLLKPRSAKKIAEDYKLANSSDEDAAKERKESVGVAREGIRVAKIKVMNRGFAVKWDEYYADLKRRGLHKGEAPQVVNRDALLDPAVAIGASGLYLHMMMTHLKTSLDSDIIVGNRRDNDWNVEILLVAAGAYNMGPGAASYVLSPIEPPDRKAWAQALMKSNEETAKYIITIRNCISSGASGSQPANLPPMLTPRFSCETGEKPRVALTEPLQLPKQYENVIKEARHVMPKKKKAKPDDDDDDEDEDAADKKAAAKKTNPKKSDSKAPAKPAVKPAVTAPAKAPAEKKPAATQPDAAKKPEKK